MPRETSSEIASVAKFPKNSREAIHISLVRYRGRALCDVRIFATTKHEGGAAVATPKGICVGMAALETLAAATNAALVEARARGLLREPGGDE